MSNVARGTITIVSNKGKATNIQLNGSDWYGCGFKTPDQLPFKKGDKVLFGFTENGQYKNVDLKTVEIDRSSAPAVSAPTAQRSGTDWAAKDKADAARQASISVQSCRNSAIELVKLLKEMDALPIPAKKADIAANVEAYVDDLTARWFEETKALANGQAPQPVVQSEEVFE